MCLFQSAGWVEPYWLGRHFTYDRKCRKTTNPDLEVLGIIPSRFRMVRRQSQDVIEDMERIYGHLLLPYIRFG